MARGWVVLVVFVLLLVLFGYLLSDSIHTWIKGKLVDLSTSPSETKTTRLFLPLFIYPSADYRLVGAAMKTLQGRLDVIVNPNNGTDALRAPNTDFVAGLDSMKVAAADQWHTLHGYVATGYGKRDINQVKAEITGYLTGWNRWVGHIFLDEVGEFQDAGRTISNTAYYREICAFIRGLSSAARIILNPGVPIGEALTTLPGVEATIMFENSVSAWGASKTLTGDKARNIAIVNLYPEPPSGDTTNISQMLKEMSDKGYDRVYLNDKDVYHKALSKFFTRLVDSLS